MLWSYIVNFLRAANQLKTAPQAAWASSGQQNSERRARLRFCFFSMFFLPLHIPSWCCLSAASSNLSVATGPPLSMVRSAFEAADAAAMLCPALASSLTLFFASFRWRHKIKISILFGGGRDRIGLHGDARNGDKEAVFDALVLEGGVHLAGCVFCSVCFESQGSALERLACQHLKLPTVRTRDRAKSVEIAVFLLLYGPLLLQLKTGCCVTVGTAYR